VCALPHTIRTFPANNPATRRRILQIFPVYRRLEGCFFVLENLNIGINIAESHSACWGELKEMWKDSRLCFYKEQ
jgi:hypothetical protein